MTSKGDIYILLIWYRSLCGMLINSVEKKKGRKRFCLRHWRFGWERICTKKKKVNNRKNKHDVTVQFAVTGMYHCGGGRRAGGGGVMNRFA